MSGRSHDSYRDEYSGYRRSSEGGSSFYSDDAAARQRAEEARRARVRESRRRIEEEPPPPSRGSRRKQEHARHDTAYDHASVRDQITQPPKEADRLHTLLLDNSGSNRVIAEHFRRGSGYLMAMLEAIDPSGALAIIYFSDHCDGPRIRQDVDFVMAGEEGNKILYSTTYHVRGASGGDAAEAIECMLHDVCDIDFAQIPQDRRHLYLVTDVVGHGMGMRDDQGCPYRRDWRESVRRVGETFGSFQVVGCSRYESEGKLQEQFLAEDRVQWDLINLSNVKSDEHRLPLTLNAFLFFLARNLGTQVVTVFLMGLYEKWLNEPIFGQQTDTKARDQIGQFLSWLEVDPEVRQEIEERIFVA